MSGSGESQPEEPAGDQGEESEVPDWLMRIRMREQAERESRSKTGEEAAAPKDWLEEMRARQDAESGIASPEEKEESALPDWISDLKAESLQEQPSTSSEPVQASGDEEDDGEWLKKLAAWNQAGSEQNIPAGQPPEEQKPAEPGSGFEQPAPPAAAGGSADESTPDWLRSFLGQPAEESQPQAGGFLSGSEEMPASEEQPVEKTISDEEKASFDEFMKSRHAELVEQNLPGEEVPGEAETQPEPEPLSESGQTAETTPGDEVYDFSSEEKSPEQPEETPHAEAASLPTAGETPAGETALSAQASEADLEWLSEYHETFEEEGQAEAATEQAGKGKEEEKPEQPFLGVNRYDWAAKPEEAAGENAEEIESAKLPPWLQKLRSVDSIPLAEAVEPAKTKTESEGPLAGIEGALQSAEVADLYTKPLTYSTKVQVTERQSMRADILRSMVEKHAVKTESAEVAAKHRFLLGKMLIGLLLIVAAVVPLVLQPGTALLPAIYPPETANAYTLVNAIPAEKTVLVAADFEAGLSGEISLSSQMLVEHLMLRNLPMAILSTNPTGSALMDSILDKAQVNAGGYDRANQVISLGYLPGGSVGLQELARDPSAAMPFTSSLTPAWDLPALQNVHAVSDFGAVVVITEDADSARYWVEQVQPVLGTTPLIVVCSAQAAPMLQPYYDSGQISGLVSGLSGAAAYEQILQRPGSAVNVYGAYQLILVILILVILIGGAVSLIRSSTQTNRA